MVDLTFFVKTLLLTLGLILFMQLRVGESTRTIESEAMLWVQSSMVTSPLRSAAHGAAKMVHDLSREISQAIHSNVKKTRHKEERSKQSQGEEQAAEIGQD